MSSSHAFTPFNTSQETIPSPYSAPLKSSSSSDTPKPTPQQPGISAPYKPAQSFHNEIQQKWPFNRHYSGFLRAFPAFLAAVFWAAQMIYFIFWFVSRPPLPNGAWPRISPTYAAFPFISCVGSVRELSFRMVSITVAVLLWTAFGIDYKLGRRSPVGKWWRMGKLVLSSVSSVFLIALSFASVVDSHTNHLIFAGFQIICMGLAKGCDWNLNRAMRARTPTNRFLKISRSWKRVVTIISTPCSIMAIIGIYGCSVKVENGEVIFTTQCWTLVSFAAPAEWVLSWCWVVFLGTVAYDNYHLDYTVGLLLSTPATPNTKRKGNGLAFWRRWTNKEEDSREKLDSWNERKGLREAAEEAEAVMDRQVVSGSKPDSMARSIESDAGQQDQYARVMNEDVEIGLLPPTMPRSVLGSNGYHQVGNSPPLDQA